MRHDATILGVFTAGFCALPLLAGNPESGTTPPTYDDVKSIIADNCQFCHSGGEEATAGVSLDTEAEVVARAKAIYNAVSTGFMPYGDDTWYLTEDGQKLLEYAKSQIVEEPEPQPAPKPAPSHPR